MYKSKNLISNNNPNGEELPNGKHNIPLPTKMALGYILGRVMTWGLDPIFPTSPEQLRGFQSPSGAL